MMNLEHFVFCKAVLATRRNVLGSAHADDARPGVRRLGDRAMTNISIPVNVRSVTIALDAQAATIRWLAAVIRSGIAVQYAMHNTPVRPVECDEINGIITINEVPRP
jgi:hypothetical protein